MFDNFNENKKNCPNCNTVLSFNTDRCFNCKYDFKLNKVVNDSLTCKSCGFEVTKDQKFCTVCGAKLEFKQCIHCNSYMDEKDDICPVCNKSQIEEVNENIPVTAEILSTEISFEKKKEMYLNMGRIRLFMFLELIMLAALLLLVLLVPFLIKTEDGKTLKFFNGLDFFKGLFTGEDISKYLLNEEGYLILSNISTSLAKPFFMIMYGGLFGLIILNFIRVFLGFNLKKPNKGIMLLILMIYLAIMTVFSEVVTFTGKFIDFDCMATYAFILVFLFWIITMFIFNKEAKHFQKKFQKD